jgi:hypothetical protein
MLYRITSRAVDIKMKSRYILVEQDSSKFWVTWGMQQCLDYTCLDAEYSYCQQVNSDMCSITD